MMHNLIITNITNFQNIYDTMLSLSKRSKINFDDHLIRYCLEFCNSNCCHFDWILLSSKFTKNHQLSWKFIILKWNIFDDLWWSHFRDFLFFSGSHSRSQQNHEDHEKCFTLTWWFLVINHDQISIERVVISMGSSVNLWYCSG